MPFGSQVPSSDTGCPRYFPGNGSSPPITVLSASGLAWERSLASASLAACQTCSCQIPSRTAAATATSISRCAPQ